MGARHAHRAASIVASRTGRRRHIDGPHVVPTFRSATTRQVDSVLDDARKINQTMVRGKYGTQAERYWGVLRTAINDLARCYNLTPLGV